MKFHQRVGLAMLLSVTFVPIIDQGPKNTAFVLGIATWLTISIIVFLRD